MVQRGQNRKAGKEVQQASPFLLLSCVPHESFLTFATLRLCVSNAFWLRLCRAAPFAAKSSRESMVSIKNARGLRALP
jgi:hypothetical protein